MVLHDNPYAGVQDKMSSPPTPAIFSQAIFFGVVLILKTSVNCWPIFFAMNACCAISYNLNPLHLNCAWLVIGSILTCTN